GTGPRTMLVRPGVGAAGHVVQRSDLATHRVVVEQASLILVEDGCKRIHWSGGECVARVGEALSVQAGEVVDFANTPGRSGTYRALWICWQPELLMAINALHPSRGPRVARHTALDEAFRAAFHRAFDAWMAPTGCRRASPFTACRKCCCGLASGASIFRRRARCRSVSGCAGFCRRIRQPSGRWSRLRMRPRPVCRPCGESWRWRAWPFASCSTMCACRMRWRCWRTPTCRYCMSRWPRATPPHRVFPRASVRASATCPPISVDRTVDAGADLSDPHGFRFTLVATRHADAVGRW
ncbi:AraC family transcriptional regulator, partial [Rhodanobacter sp. 115]